ncbi:hypothetical protein [Pseudomonas haemolytica]|uniref:ApeA N-terminal domain-containing protein n=1 Tax=Pseudomonas haemolytica TaxID=2600065 RepID=A0ABS1GXB0_9PSED|nr:hypothetical protein [Pseudomonas haemolytica]MBK3461619.1 hypothetical protein [Pseudomonas haemolytica]
MSLENIANRLISLGCSAEIDEKCIVLTLDDTETTIRFDEEWENSITSFYKARQFNFDVERRMLTSNRSVELLVARLDPGFYYQVEHKFNDIKGNTVELSLATQNYFLAHFESKRYEDTFDIIKQRLTSLASRRTGTRKRLSIRFDELLYRLHTIKYSAKRKPTNQSIYEASIQPIKACLFSLVYKKDESWELSHEIKSKRLKYPQAVEKTDDPLEIPRASYDDAAVTFYKVAKSSQFPSQAFIAYYHILEFHFLRVADESLFNAVCTQLNNPDFRSTYENVTRLLAAIKRNDNTSSEKEMLLAVLRKYVAEEEFVEFVARTEKSAGEPIFTKFKAPIFGEKFSFNLEKGHALNSASAIIKHIRNALVHSSDRYSREDCFLPLSESEDLVVRYIPIVKFFAERVIFATAQRQF